MNRLKEAREKLNLSLREVARRARLDKDSLLDLEKNRRKAQASTLARLSEVLSIPITELSDLQSTAARENGQKGGQATARKRLAKTDSLANTDSLSMNEYLRQDAERVRQLRREARQEARDARKDIPATMRPLHSWVGLEDGTVRHFKGNSYQQAKEYARSQEGRARVYRAPLKADKRIKEIHSQFITEWHNARVEWPNTPRITEIKV